MANPYVALKNKMGGRWQIPQQLSDENVVALNNQMPTNPTQIAAPSPGPVVDPEAMAQAQQTQGLQGMSSGMQNTSQDSSKSVTNRTIYRTPKQEEILQKIYSGITPGVAVNDLGEDQYTQEYAKDENGNPIADPMTGHPKMIRGEPIYDPERDVVNPEHPVQQEKAGVAHMEQMLRDRMENAPTQTNLSPLAALADYLAPGGKAQAGYAAFRKTAPTYGEQADDFMKAEDTLQKRRTDIAKSIQDAIKAAKSGTTLEQIAMLNGLKTQVDNKTPKPGGNAVDPIKTYTTWSQTVLKDTVLKDAMRSRSTMATLDNILKGKVSDLDLATAKKIVIKASGDDRVSDNDYQHAVGSAGLIEQMDQYVHTAEGAGGFTNENKAAFLATARKLRNNIDHVYQERILTHRNNGQNYVDQGAMNSDAMNKLLSTFEGKSTASEVPIKKVKAVENKVKALGTKTKFVGNPAASSAPGKIPSIDEFFGPGGAGHK